MTSTGRGPDENRVAHLLRTRGVGPDAHPTATASPDALAPEQGPDWFDRLCAWQEAGEQQAAAPAPVADRIPPWWATKPVIGAEQPVEEEWQPILTSGRTPPPTLAPVEQPAATEATGDEGEQPAPAGWWTADPGYWPHPHWPALPQPAERIALAPRTRTLLYNASAAALGYGLGLAPHLNTWIRECGTQVGIPAALVLGTGGCIAVAHLWDRRTRHWWPGLAWAARIPLASAVLALGLYAPLH